MLKINLATHLSLHDGEETIIFLEFDVQRMFQALCHKSHPRSVAIGANLFVKVAQFGEAEGLEARSGMDRFLDNQIKSIER